MTPAARLRSRLSQRPALLVPGAANALTALVLQGAGFEAVYVSGAGIANTYLGAPDIGLLTLSELSGHVAAMSEAVDLPLVVDADTGFGNAMNVQRTVRSLERAGASAIQLEDQVAPKRCGHFDGQRVIAASEMVGKIQAAADARVDHDLVLVARTDARSSLGLEAACDRAANYLEAGADVVFVEAPRDRTEMAIVTGIPGLHVANMVEGGKTPVLPLAELTELGFAMVLYANTAMRAAIASMTKVAERLRADGDSLAITAEIASWQKRQELVRKPEFDALDDRYAGQATGVPEDS